MELAKGEPVLADYNPKTNHIRFFGEITKRTIAHEFAHALTHKRGHHEDNKAHGPEFNRAWREVVHVVGQTAS